MLKKMSLLCAAAMLAFSLQTAFAAEDEDVPEDVVQYDNPDDGQAGYGNPCWNNPADPRCHNWYGPGMRWRGGRGHGPAIPPGMRTPPPGEQMGGPGEPGPMGMMCQPGMCGPGGPGRMGMMGHPGMRGPGGPGPMGMMGHRGMMGGRGWGHNGPRGFGPFGDGAEMMGLPGISHGRIMEQLDLTDAQKNQLVDLLTNNFRNRLQNRMEMQGLRNQLRELQKSPNPDSGTIISLNQNLGAARGKLEVMKNQLKTDLKNILTEEQQKKLDDMKDQWKGRWGGKDRGFQKGPRGQNNPKMMRGPGPVVNPAPQL